MFGGVVERRLRTIDVAQSRAFTTRRKIIGANRFWRVTDTIAENFACVGQAKEGHHVILIDAVAGNSDGADELRIPVDWKSARENLDSILGACKTGTANDRRAGRGCNDRVVIQIELQPQMERAPVAVRRAEWTGSCQWHRRWYRIRHTYYAAGQRTRSVVTAARKSTTAEWTYEGITLRGLKATRSDAGW